MRRYDLHPWPPHTRHSWEFQAVIAGRCGLWLPGRTEWRTSTLWLFPPDCSHGWTGDAHGCTVCVVHLADVPDLLRLAARQDGYLEIALDLESVSELHRLTSEAMAIRLSDPLAGIVSDLISAQLSLLMAKLMTRAEPDRWTDPVNPGRLVEDALAWFSEHLPHRPTVNDAAAALNCTPLQLRRHFRRLKGQTPHEALAEIRLRRAEELFRDSTLTLESVAERCGFSDGSTLSRAYRSARGISPSKIAGRRSGQA